MVVLVTVATQAVPTSLNGLRFKIGLLSGYSTKESLKKSALLHVNITILKGVCC